MRLKQPFSSSPGGLDPPISSRVAAPAQQKPPQLLGQSQLVPPSPEHGSGATSLPGQHQHCPKGCCRRCWQSGFSTWGIPMAFVQQRGQGQVQLLLGLRAGGKGSSPRLLSRSGCSGQRHSIPETGSESTACAPGWLCHCFPEPAGTTAPAGRMASVDPGGCNKGGKDGTVVHRYDLW